MKFAVWIFWFLEAEPPEPVFQNNNNVNVVTSDGTKIIVLSFEELFVFVISN